MIKREVLKEVLDYVTGKKRNLNKGAIYRQVNQALKVYLHRGEFNPNLDGEKLYNNAKECLELAEYEVEIYEA